MLVRYLRVGIDLADGGNIRYLLVWTFNLIL